MSDIVDWIVAGTVGVLVTACAGLFVRLRTNETRLAVLEAAEERNKGVEKAVSDLAIVNAQIVERLQHLPTKDDLQLLHNRVSKNGDATNAAAVDIGKMSESMRGLRQAVDRLHQLELARAKDTT